MHVSAIYQLLPTEDRGLGPQSLTKEQVILEEDDSADSITDNLGRQRTVPETPKSQRYATRPALEKIFEGSILSDRAKRDRRIREAVEKYGYTHSAGRG
jgi:superfamily I DNA/RNA helicase